MVPQPVVAVLLLFPVTKDSEAVKDKGNPKACPGVSALTMPFLPF